MLKTLYVVPSGGEVSGVGKKGRKMADDKILATLILDKEMIVTDMPCTGATLIAQYPDRYIVMAFTADRTCTLGLEGEQPISIGINELLDLMKAKRDEALH